MLRIHPAARKHGISDADIEHVVRQAMTIDDRDNETRFYLGTGWNGELIEVVTVARGKRAEMAIHAMKMRPKYIRLLIGRRQ